MMAPLSYLASLSDTTASLEQIQSDHWEWEKGKYTKYKEACVIFAWLTPLGTFEAIVMPAFF